MRKGQQCDKIYFILEGNIIIQQEQRISRPISSSQTTSQILKNTNISTLTQQITKSKFTTINKVKLLSKYDVINEENALLSKLLANDNAICQTSCRLFEVNFSDFQKIFHHQVNEIRHRMSMFSKYFDLEEIDSSTFLSFSQICIEQQYNHGDKIYRIGEKALGFYFVKSGTIEISQFINNNNNNFQGYNNKNNQIIIDLVNSNEFCGIEELNNQNYQRIYDATVQSDIVKVLFIPISYFDNERNYAHSDYGRMELYKIFMRQSKDKTKRYSAQLDKFKEQIHLLQNNQSKSIINSSGSGGRERSSQSQRVSIQEIINFEKQANKRFNINNNNNNNLISERQSTNIQYDADTPLNILYPSQLPPKPNKSQLINNNNMNKSQLSTNNLSSLLKMKTRNHSQIIGKTSGRFYNNNNNNISNDCLNKRDRDSLNQTYELQTGMLINNNNNQNEYGQEQLPIHSHSATRQQQQQSNGVMNQSSLSGNYKVLFKKYLDSKNKSTSQYSIALNASQQIKDKQNCIINQMDQKMPQVNDDKYQPNFMISTQNNTLKPLTKNFQDKQDIEYGGTLFNNLMLSKSIKQNLTESNNNQLNENNNSNSNNNLLLSYNKVNGKMRVTMASFKSNKNIKQKENQNPENQIQQDDQSENDYLNNNNNNDKLLNAITSEENSPLKKKYQLNSKLQIYQQKQPLSQKKQNETTTLFFENKQRGSSILDNNSQCDIKNENDYFKKQQSSLNNLSQSQRKSLTPLKQAQINIQPLIHLRQSMQAKNNVTPFQDNNNNHFVNKSAIHSNNNKQQQLQQSQLQQQQQNQQQRKQQQQLEISYEDENNNDSSSNNSSENSFDSSSSSQTYSQQKQNKHLHNLV